MANKNLPSSKPKDRIVFFFKWNIISIPDYISIILEYSKSIPKVKDVRNIPILPPSHIYIHQLKDYQEEGFKMARSWFNHQNV